MSVATEVNERLRALTEAGTSVWLDQIRRGLIEGGELKRLIEQDSLRGVTSNPAIFEKAILGSDEYDEELARLAGDGLEPAQIYDEIAITDVRMAADVLRSVYDETAGYDGYVSLEVAPSLAHDTDGTIEQARAYWKRVDRPNLMIKIPGTDAGLPAIEQRDLRGHQRERDAAVLGRGVHAGHGALHPRPRDAHGARRVGGRALGGELLRLPRGQRGGQAARAGRPGGPLRPRRRWPTPAPPTPASRRSSTAIASPTSGRRGLRFSARSGRPRGSRTLATRTRSTWTAWSARPR